MNPLLHSPVTALSMAKRQNAPKSQWHRVLREVVQPPAAKSRGSSALPEISEISEIPGPRDCSPPTVANSHAQGLALDELETAFTLLATFQTVQIIEQRKKVESTNHHSSGYKLKRICPMFQAHLSIPRSFSPNKLTPSTNPCRARPGCPAMGPFQLTSVDDL